jgi:ectoine hydroxylase-related dioxygenase (phytanoyl-CoA dioxygenase family)
MSNVNDEQIAQFRRDGFVRIPRLVDAATVAELRDAYDTLIERGATGAGTRDSRLGGLTRQIVYPERSHPLFRDNAALRAGLEAARALCGWDEPAYFYSQLLYKPPGHPHATPWHQDDAYGAVPFAAAGTPLSHATLQFWLALDNVDVDNGCMHFHPPLPSDVLQPHRVAAGDPDADDRLLGLADEAACIDPAAVVACPLAAGGATVHGSGTLHYTPPNRSARPRRAYIFNFADPAFVARLTT